MYHYFVQYIFNQTKPCCVQSVNRVSPVYWGSWELEQPVIEYSELGFLSRLDACVYSKFPSPNH